MSCTPNPYHMLNNYRLNKGKKSTKYVQALNVILYGNLFAGKGVARKDVHIAMGWNPASGNRSAMWAELHRIGYTRYDAKSKTLHITDKGISYLRNNDLLINYKSMCEVLQRPNYFKLHVAYLAVE